MAQGYAYLPTPDILNYFGSNPAVVPATETLLATYTVPVAKTATLEYVYGGGGTDGMWKLYVNASPYWFSRNAWTQRNIQDTLQISLVAGDVVELKVTNLKLTNHLFTGGFYVHEL